jgi:hypothetical protein
MMLIKIRFFLALKCILLAQNILGQEVRDDAASTPKAQLVKLDPPGKQSQLKIKKKEMNLIYVSSFSHKHPC